MRAEYAAGENNAAKICSYEFHEGRYLQMRGSKLPDGCASQDFADKCNELETQHLPYFRTIRLEAETLSECYLDFMPAALKSLAIYNVKRGVFFISNLKYFGKIWFERNPKVF
jgi:hypothetical protein